MKYKGSWGFKGAFKKYFNRRGSKGGSLKSKRKHTGGRGRWGWDVVCQAYLDVRSVKEIA